MVRNKIFIVFTLFFAFFFLFSQSISYAFTYNQFMELTSAGASKVSSAASKVGAGIWLGRAVLGLTALGGAVSVGLTLWDAYNRYTDSAKASIPAGSVQNLSPAVSISSPSSDSIGWGMQSSQAASVYCVSYPAVLTSSDPCSLVIQSPQPCETSSVPNNAQVVGGQTIINYQYYGGCPSKPNWKLVNSVKQSLYYVQTPVPSASYVPQSLATPAPSSDVGNTKVATETLVQSLNKLQSSLDAANNSVQQLVAAMPADSKVSIPAISAQMAALTEALNVLKNGVPVQKGTDYIVADNDKAVPVPAGQGPGEGGQPQPSEPPVQAPPISDGTCQDCVRKKTFQQVWANISTAASNAPLLSFLNKLVINPSAGQKTTTAIVSASGFGSHTVDLNAWGLDTFVGIIRFIIIGGAFVAAYYIIFS